MMGALANHLWQSTVFAVAAGLLAVAFRKNQAQVRYWLWFSASVKFFIPFTLLINLGGQLDWVPAAQQRAAPLSMVQITQPFSDGWSAGLPLAPPTPATPDWSRIVVLGVWVCGFAAIALMRMRVWRRIQAAVRASSAWKRPGVEMPASVDVRTSPGLLEPGIVGLWRPILLLPASIEEHLTRPQLEAVLAHELCHVRRHDNVTAAIHMIVEAVFWFHPLVWWIGARLVEERERACDEDVLRAFGAPQAYAEGLLNVCKRYVESPLVCVPGVSGANLRKRIEAIMKNDVGATLKFWKKCLLAAAAAVAIAAPLAIGVVSAPRLEAQQFAQADATNPAFEVASVKVNKSNDARGGVGIGPGGRVNATNVTLRVLVRSAYSLMPFQIVGGLAWLDSTRYDVVAKASTGDLNDKGFLIPDKAELLWRALLANRFKLTSHRERRELPVYRLTLARTNGTLGPRLRKSAVDCEALRTSGPGAAPPPYSGFGDLPPCTMRQPVGHVIGNGMPWTFLVQDLSAFTGRPVIDDTGLSGAFDFDLEWAPEQLAQFDPLGLPNQVRPAAPSSGPSLFTAVQEQLGLKLESTRGPVEVLVIDHVEQPTPD